MAETRIGDGREVEEPPRSTHAGELYRFQLVWWQKLVVGTFAAVVSIVLVSLGVHLLTATGRSGSTAFGVVSIAAAIVVAYGLWRTTESRVVITEQGVKIHNHVRSYNLSWDKIDGYEATNHHYLRLATGRRIRLYGLSEGPMGASARAERQANRLNAEIERHKPAPTGSPVDATPSTPKS